MEASFFGDFYLNLCHYQIESGFLDTTKRFQNVCPMFVDLVLDCNRDQDIDRTGGKLRLDELLNV